MKEKKNIVFIAQSLDGYIADKNGGLEWLEAIPNPENKDHGYAELMSEVDAMIMGRKTFETVLGFSIEWPYKIPVFVLSNSLKEIPVALEGKIQLLNGSPKEIVAKIHEQNHNCLYIDGGNTIQRFLVAELIDELRITTLPVLLGGGFSLFGSLIEPIDFDHIKTEVFLDQMVQSHYRRRK